MPSLKINDRKIDWENSDSHYMFNSRHPEGQKLKALAKKLPFFKGHIYLFSSGGEKICILSKPAFLHSAQAVNKHLKTEKKDRWLISLPLFHVGGLAIPARAFQGGFSCPSGSSSWSVQKFQKELKEKKISLSSLVPAQIYDLVKYNIKAPQTLRALIAGGGALPPWLYHKARELSWPLLVSYGLTEACSQVACSSLPAKKTFPKMQILDHIRTKNLQSKTKIKSPSLLTACFDVQSKKLYDPKDSKGFLELADRILLKKNSLTVQGRSEEFIKIAGETVSLQKLFFILQKLSQNSSKEYRLTVLPDSRRGFYIAMLSNSFNKKEALSLAKNFNRNVLPFERIKSIYFVSNIQKSTLFKVRLKDMNQQLGL